MGKYIVAKVSGKKPKVLKRFNSASAAQKFRTKFYKNNKRSRLWVIGPRGIVGLTTYNK